MLWEPTTNEATTTEPTTSEPTTSEPTTSEPSQIRGEKNTNGCVEYMTAQECEDYAKTSGMNLIWNQDVTMKKTGERLQK